MKSSAEHGLADAVCSIEALYQEHADEVGEAAVSMQVGAGFERSDPHGGSQPIIFQMKDLEVADGEKQQMNQLARDIQVSQGMPQGNNRGSGKKR